MHTPPSTDIANLKAEIAAQLGFDPKNPPVNVGDKLAAEVTESEADDAGRLAFDGPL